MYKSACIIVYCQLLNEKSKELSGSPFGTIILMHSIKKISNILMSITDSLSLSIYIYIYIYNFFDPAMRHAGS